MDMFTSQGHIKKEKLKYCFLMILAWLCCFNIIIGFHNHNLNFHPLEVVSRYRDPQLQVGENTIDNPYFTVSMFKPLYRGHLD